MQYVLLLQIRWDDGTIGYLKLEEVHKDHWVQIPAPC